MKEMPTQELPADSEYIYIPETDDWKVQKKSGNKILSKKDYGEEAICPSCGLWKPTDFSPEQLKEMDWECMDCMNKRLTNPQDLPENRGEKEFSKFDPEYEFFLKLVKVVLSAGVPLQEIQSLGNKYRFTTVNDIENMTTKIWTLATEKYHIPRQWLIKRLPEKRSSLNIKGYEGGYPTEEDATYWGGGPQGTVAYEPSKHDSQTGLREGDTGEPIVICPKCKSDKVNIESSPAKCLDCGTDFVPKLDRGSDDPAVNDYNQNYFWGPNDLGRSHQNQPGANGWLPAGTEDMDGPSSNVRMSNFKSFMHKQSVLNTIASDDVYVGKIDFLGKMYSINVPADKLAEYFAVIEKMEKTKDPNELELLDEQRSSLHYEMTQNALAETGLTGDIKAEASIVEVISNFVEREFREGFYRESSLNEQAHCGPCSALKMEALHILIDLYYKDNDLFPEEVIEELSLAATELKLDNFNDLLESGITEYLEEKSEEIGDKLPKLKNLLIALKDIAPKLGKEIEVVDKQENVEKEADLKEYSNEETKNVNNFIIQNPSVMERVIEQSKYSVDDFELSLRLKALMTQLDYWDYQNKNIRWDELSYAWFHTVKRDEPLPGSAVVDIQNLPTLDKEKKLNELLEQLSVETDLQKKERIKQHIERIKNASLKLAKEEVPTLSNKIVTDLIPMFVDKTEPPDHKCKTCSFRVEKDGRATCAIMKGEINLEKGSCNYWSEREVTKNADSSKMERKTAGYVEVEGTINCSTCAHYEHDFCKLWQGSVKDEQCCMAWEGATTKEGSLDKKANPPSRFWIAPDGKEFEVAGVHGSWTERNSNILKQYGIKPAKNRYDIGRVWDDMGKQGWIRISNEPAGTGFQIELNDIHNIPSYVDDFIAKYYKKDEIILIADSSNSTYLNDPFPTIQKAVEKELRKPVMSSKQASLIDEVLDQDTQNAIAAEYGPSILIALRFYNDGVRYGQDPTRSMAYALEEVKRMGRPIDQKDFLEVLNTYFQ